MEKSKNREDKGVSEERRVKTYMQLALLFIFIAFISVLLVPRGSSVQRCSASPIAQNKFSCFHHEALQTGNSSLCSYLPSQSADSCYGAIALNTSNPTLCGNIKNASSSGICFSSIANQTQDYTLCYRATGSYRSTCLLNMAVQKQNASICSGINMTKDRIACSSTVYYSKARKSSNITACSYISNNSNSDLARQVSYTYSQYYGNGSTAEYNLTVLLNYADLSNITIGARDFCYFSLAYSLQKKVYCSGIINKQASSICTAVSAPTKANITALNYTPLLNQCYNSTRDMLSCNSTIGIYKALQAKNASICGQLPSFFSAECYSSLAQVYSDISFCSYIKNGTLNSACVLNIGNRTNTTIS